MATKNQRLYGMKKFEEEGRSSYCNVLWDAQAPAHYIQTQRNGQGQDHSCMTLSCGVTDSTIF